MYILRGRGTCLLWAYARHTVHTCSVPPVRWVDTCNLVKTARFSRAGAPQRHDQESPWASALGWTGWNAVGFQHGVRSQALASSKGGASEGIDTTERPHSYEVI